MTAFTDHAIDLLEEVARASGNRIQMNRRGYALVTRRQNPDDLIGDLHRGYANSAEARSASTRRVPRQRISPPSHRIGRQPRTGSMSSQTGRPFGRTSRAWRRMPQPSSTSAGQAT